MRHNARNVLLMGHCGGGIRPLTTNGRWLGSGVGGGTKGRPGKTGSTETVRR